MTRRGGFALTRWGWVHLSPAPTLTRGHPFFTKLVCQRVLVDACKRRISYVSVDDVSAAADRCAEEEESQSFQHFWKDGILASADKQATVSRTRAKILLAMGDLLRGQHRLTEAAIVKHEAVVNDGPSVFDELRAFVRRGVLVEDGGAFDFMVPLFRNWVVTSGSSKVITELPDPDNVLKRLNASASEYVKPAEILQLIPSWTFKWRKITSDDVRAWLDQFGSPSDQRLMFKLLQGLRFFQTETYKNKLQEYYRALGLRYARFRESGTRKRGDFLISYVDAPAKSGAAFARLFVMANQIYFGNLVERSELMEQLRQRDDVTAVVFIDDFVATGGTAVDGLTGFWGQCGAEVEARRIGVHFVGIVGSDVGVKKLQSCELAKSYDRFEFEVFEVLGAADRAFAEESKIFPDATERSRAREIAISIGRNLEPKHPLGYADGQYAVVFDSNCPNNSLPILWKARDDWRPLFPRQGA